MITHVKARSERPAIYPERTHVPDERVSWDVPFPGYSPPYFVADTVLRHEGAWADPEDLTRIARRLESALGTLRFDGAGRPLNPCGRTGIAGRGLLGRWGTNPAGDPFVTRFDPDGGTLQALFIRRKDSGTWALPGGMMDPGEDARETAARELFEEAGSRVDFSAARMVYQGYVDDPRNTDHAWMETTCLHRHLSAEEAAALVLEAGDDADAVRWVTLTPAALANLYGSHAALVRDTLRGWLDHGSQPLPAAVQAQIRELL